MITDINLVNFRSYTNESFELSSGVNIIVGPNASGKTNLLEAILVVSKGSSYRAKDIELIQFNKPWARIEAHTEDFSRVVKIELLGESRATKTFNINTKVSKRLSLNQAAPVVLFEPNHLLMLSGSPEFRRNYLDDILEQTKLGFKSLRSQYKRALAQRNSLLKQDAGKNELFVWNIRLSELAGQIFKDRIDLIGNLSSMVPEIYKSLSGDAKNIELIYISNCRPTNYETDLLHKLEESLAIDIARGFTTHGPHRDDVKVTINNHLVGEVASRGEMRTLLLALKVVEAQTIEILRNQKPLLLFDDVFSELDGARRLALTHLLKEYQVFITTTDADIVLQYFTQNSNIIPLN